MNASYHVVPWANGDQMMTRDEFRAAYKARLKAAVLDRLEGKTDLEKCFWLIAMTFGPNVDIISKFKELTAELELAENSVEVSCSLSGRYP